MFSRNKHVIIGLLLGCVVCSVASHYIKQRRTLPVLRGTETYADLNGATYSPEMMKGSAGTVFIFLGTECPISNRYIPEMNSISAICKPEQIAFYGVFTDKATPSGKAKSFVRLFDVKFPILIDEKHDLIKKLGITVTPEAAVLDATGNLVYRGRVDNMYSSLGTYRQKATVHDLIDVINKLRTQLTLNPRFTKAVGCLIAKP